MNYTKIFISLIAVLALTGCNKITSLNSPILKTPDNINTGGKVVLVGSGFPDAKVLIFVNNEYKHDTLVNKAGKFNVEFQNNNEGEVIIKTQQTYKNITSEFSNEIALNIDLTPPESILEIETEIPLFTKEKQISIKGSTNPSTIVVLNDRRISSDSSGNFSFENISLSNGMNKFKISLEDNYGNATEILKEYTINVDSVPPKIKTSFCNNRFTKSELVVGEELVCLSIGEWQGWGGFANIPITGNIEGELKKITVDGKQIFPDENDEIFQRINLATPYGLNKYKVIAEDVYGNISSANLTQTVVDPSTSRDDDILDRLDDIESQIDDLY